MVPASLPTCEPNLQERCRLLGLVNGGWRHPIASLLYLTISMVVALAARLVPGMDRFVAWLPWVLLFLVLASSFLLLRVLKQAKEEGFAEQLWLVVLTVGWLITLPLGGAATCSRTELHKLQQFHSVRFSCYHLERRENHEMNLPEKFIHQATAPMGKPRGRRK